MDKNTQVSKTKTGNAGKKQKPERPATKNTEQLPADLTGNEASVAAELKNRER